MKYRKLGKTRNKVSVVGFGCGPIGGTGWGKVKKRDAIAAIKKALELGINLFDVAPVYGFGRAEKILGKALRSKRKKVLINTKCGLERNRKGKVFANGRPRHIRKDCEKSLKNLKTDYIDILQIHAPDLSVPFSETIGEMLRLQKEGKIRFLGFSNFTIPQMKECLQYSAFTSLQSRYNLLERKTEEKILPFCKNKGISFFSHTSLAMGLLSGRFSENTKIPEGDIRKVDALFHSDNFKRNLRITAKVAEIAVKCAMTPVQVAIAWILQKNNVTCALVGARKPLQIEDSAGATKDISPALLRELNEIHYGVHRDIQQTSL